MPNTQQSSSEKTWKECQAWVSSGTHETDGRQRKSSKSERLKDFQSKNLSVRSKTGRVSNRKVIQILQSPACRDEGTGNVLRQCTWAEGHR